MKILSFDVRAVLIPMAEPHRTASGVIAASPLVLLSVTTDQGVQGHSITFTYTQAALKPTAELMKNMEPLVAGQALAPAALSEQLQRRFRLLDAQGLVGMALAGIDMALWDALLGAAPKPVPCYGGIGYDGAADSARAAVGPQLAVMVDYHQSLTPGEARSRLQALDGEGLKSPLRLRDGLADLDGVLASGVEFDDDATRKYAA